MVYMYHSFLIHSSADGHLGCFHVLAMINSSMQTVFLRSLKGDGNLFDLDYCGAYTGTYTCQDLK